MLRIFHLFLVSLLSSQIGSTKVVCEIVSLCFYKYILVSKTSGFWREKTRRQGREIGNKPSTQKRFSVVLNTSFVFLILKRVNFRVVEVKATIVYQLMDLPESALVALEGFPHHTTEQQIIKESNKRGKKIDLTSFSAGTCKHQALK